MNKKKSLLKHAQKRTFERYGLTLNHQQIKDMGFMCKNNNYICHLGKQSLTRSKIVIKYQNNIYPVIYDKTRHCIITVLTYDMLSLKEKNNVENSLKYLKI